MTYAVIMAGGSGTRFWPKSTKALPKQFLHLFGEGTMLQNTVNRVSDLIPIENVLVVTNERYVEIVKEQLPGIPAENVIAECVAKNTAPCVAIAAAILKDKDEESTMVVLPADHHITEPETFRNYLKSAIHEAETNNTLVTIGIEPDRPETGYGYIKGNKESFTDNGIAKAYKVEGFREKPDLETAKEYVASGDYFWNSGMFIWKSSTVLNSIAEFLPEMYKLSLEAVLNGSSQADIDNFYQKSESISIDYGIMESSTNIQVVPGEFGWNDVGSWTAAYDLAEKDKQGVSANDAQVINIESSNNYVSLSSDKLVALVGVEGLTIVETEDAILIGRIDKAQHVKKVVEELKSNEELNKYL